MGVGVGGEWVCIKPWSEQNAAVEVYQYISAIVSALDVVLNQAYKSVKYHISQWINKVQNQ